MTREPGLSGLEILRAARHLVRRFGVMEGARRAGVCASTLRAAAMNPDHTRRKTARRIVRAGHAAGAFDQPRETTPALPASSVPSPRTMVVVSLDAARMRRNARART